MLSRQGRLNGVEQPSIALLKVSKRVHAEAVYALYGSNEIRLPLTIPPSLDLTLARYATSMRSVEVFYVFNAEVHPHVQMYEVSDLPSWRVRLKDSTTARFLAGYPYGDETRSLLNRLTGLRTLTLQFSVWPSSSWRDHEFRRKSRLLLEQCLNEVTSVLLGRDPPVKVRLRALTCTPTPDQVVPELNAFCSRLGIEFLGTEP